jgi:hypothetical protein
METLQKTMAVRLISIERILKDHSSILASLQERVEALHGLLERLDVRVEARFDALEAERLAERITALESRVTALEAAKS